MEIKLSKTTIEKAHAPTFTSNLKNFCNIMKNNKFGNPYIDFQIDDYQLSEDAVTIETILAILCGFSLSSFRNVFYTYGENKMEDFYGLNFYNYRKLEFLQESNKENTQGYRDVLDEIKLVELEAVVLQDQLTQLVRAMEASFYSKDFLILSDWNDLYTYVDPITCFRWLKKKGYELSDVVEDWLVEDSEFVDITRKKKIEINQSIYAIKETLEEKIHALRENGITNVGIIANLLHSQGNNSHSLTSLGQALYADKNQTKNDKDVREKIKKAMAEANNKFEIILV